MTTSTEPPDRPILGTLVGLGMCALAIFVEIGQRWPAAVLWFIGAIFIFGSFSPRRIWASLSGLLSRRRSV